MDDTVLRGLTLSSSEPLVSGTPYLVVKPSLNPYRWDNSYTGINSVVTSTDASSNKYVHAFVHVEDWYQNPPTLNDTDSNGNRDWNYSRIGYWRSSANDGCDFHAQKAYGDTVYTGTTTISDASPIIECFMPEYAINHVDDGNRQVYGVQSPSVIKHTTDSYYYMFFARYVDGSPLTGFGYGGSYYPPACGGAYNQICLARCIAVDLEDIQGYVDQSNPWHKYYYEGSVQCTNGRGGYSTPIITDNYRCQPKVHYNDKFDQYMMICKGSDGFYIYLSSGSNVTSWGSGMLLLANPPEGNYYNYPSLISTTGDDKYGNGDFQLYYSCYIGSSAGNRMYRRWTYFD